MHKFNQRTDGTSTCYLWSNLDKIRIKVVNNNTVNFNTVQAECPDNKYIYTLSTEMYRQKWPVGHVNFTNFFVFKRLEMYDHGAPRV